MNKVLNARTVAALRFASHRISTTIATSRSVPAFQLRTFTLTHRMSSHPTDLSTLKNNTMTGANGVTSLGKRVQKRPPADEPPRKQHRTQNNNNTESIRTHIPENIMSTHNEEHELEGIPIVPVIRGPADEQWQKTIESVVKNVVSIQFCQTSAFDTEYASASQATGFVVDAERGLIMTNRHVVGPGPFWGHCIFDNHEEVDVYAVYRDPVHDFGFLRFDPKAIKYMKVSSLNLRPDLAKVGVEIRVVGNDAGEKLSILSGVISRLDRNAPEYFGYCDFNTNYIQAAASASGGSSGSPVVNVDGYAIALQAGGRSDGAATDYFLPLDRPLRALRCIQNGEPITRGTIQCQWMTKPFDECRRLGLSPEWEDAMRTNFPKETGLLVAETVLPNGPSDSKVEEGDILVKVNGQLLTQFVLLDDILDTHVGGKVRLLLQRGGEDVEVEVEVGDLHKITPDRFVTVCGSEFHELSYQQARYYAVPVQGVFICEGNAGFRFESQGYGCILLSIADKKTPDLDTFIEVMKGLPDKARVKVTYKHLSDIHTQHWSIVNIDRHWSKKMRMAIRNDETGLWDFKDIADAIPALPPVPEKGSFIQLANAPHPAAGDIVHSFVRITCQMPLKLEGFPYNQKFGVGIVIDAAKGLVVCSRAIVPFDMCDIRLTVADSIIVEAKVVFLHPLQNYTIIQYDPSLVDAPVKSAKLSNTELQQGASAYFVGFNENFRIVYAKTTVTEITTVTIPANAAAPRYRALTVNAITLDTNLSQQCANGVLIDQEGNVAALWLTYLADRDQKKDNEYYLGLPTPTMLPVIKKLQAGEVPKLRMLNVELGWPIRMSQARIMGVSEEWINKVALDNPARHQLFPVHKRIVEQSDCEGGTLMEGDVILTLNGKLVTRVSDLDVMFDHEELDAVIVRESKEMQIKVKTIPADDLETDRVVLFCGAIIHRAHLAVRQQISKLHSEVYVAGRFTGSPASQYGLDSTSSITHVNGKETTDIESFMKAVVKIPDNTYFRLKIMSFDDVPLVITLKKCEHYFPTVEMIKDPNEPTGWRRITYENNKAIQGEGSDGINILPHETADVEEMEE